MDNSKNTRIEIANLKKEVSLLETKLDKQLTAEALKKSTNVKSFILNVACEVFGVDMDELTSKARDRYLLHPRSFCYWVMVNDHSISKTGAARVFNRAHGTVINSLKKVPTDMSTSPVYRRQMNRGREMVSNFTKEVYG